jgi:hypothetical protein
VRAQCVSSMRADNKRVKLLIVSQLIAVLAAAVMHYTDSAVADEGQ